MTCISIAALTKQTDFEKETYNKEERGAMLHGWPLVFGNMLFQSRSGAYDKIIYANFRLSIPMDFPLKVVGSRVAIFRIVFVSNQ